MKREVLVLMLLLAGGVLSACGDAFHGESLGSDPAPEIEALNWDGEPFRLSALRGQVAVLFFGYTSCPDVCPTTLSRMKTLYKRLGERSNAVAIVFVSVDPRRDTAERMAQYVPGFHPDFYGLRLEIEALRELIRSWEIEVHQHPAPRDNPSGFYPVDHPGSLFLVDKAGRLRVEAPEGLELEKLQADVVRLIEEPRPAR